MIAPLLALLPLLAPEPILLRAGLPIQLDGRVEAAEWSDSLTFVRPMPRMRKHPDTDRKLTVHLKRTGPWLALALRGDKQYDGEYARLFVTDDAGAYITGMVLSVGNVPYPPAIWRRGPRGVVEKMIPESPRCCLARVDVASDEGWAAEYLIALGGVGIGKGDARGFKGLLSVAHAENGDYLTLPAEATDVSDPGGYAPLVSEERWGAGEEWPEPDPACSAEYDDQELLHRLFLEFANVSQRMAPERLVISDAVRARSLNKVEALKRQLEAAERRNPTLPAWRYYKARLCHEGNLFPEARALIDGFTGPLMTQEPVAVLAVEHYLDVQDLDSAEVVLRGWMNPATLKEPRFSVAKLRQAMEAETKWIAEDAAKAEKNPVVRLETDKGSIVCELFEDDSENAVRNFMHLVLDGRYYDGMRFHMVTGGFSARVGDPRSRGGTTGEMDGPNWRLQQNHSKRPMLRGRLSMVPVTKGIMHGSQFVVTVAPVLRDEEDAEVFGRVIEGQEVVDSLDQNDRLVRVVVVEQRRHAYEPRGRVR